MRLAAMLGFGRADRTIRTLDEAIDAAAMLPGFAAFDAVIGDDGHAALAIDASGRIAVLRVRGERVIAREVEWPMLRQTGEGIVIETGDRRFDATLLRGVSAIDIRRLGMPPLMQRELATIVPELAGV